MGSKTGRERKTRAEFPLVVNAGEKTKQGDVTGSGWGRGCFSAAGTLDLSEEGHLSRELSGEQPSQFAWD